MITKSEDSLRAPFFVVVEYQFFVMPMLLFLRLFSVVVETCCLKSFLIPNHVHKQKIIIIDLDVWFPQLEWKKTLNPFDILSNRNKYFGKLLTGGRLHENGIIEIKTLAIFRSAFFFLQLSFGIFFLFVSMLFIAAFARNSLK